MEHWKPKLRRRGTVKPQAERQTLNDRGRVQQPVDGCRRGLDGWCSVENDWGHHVCGGRAEAKGQRARLGLCRNSRVLACTATPEYHVRNSAPGLKLHQTQAGNDGTVHTQPRREGKGTRPSWHITDNKKRN